MKSKDHLRALRNELPMDVTLRMLGRRGPPSKTEDGRCRFLCPYCQEMRAQINPSNNLAHCFGCQKNINNIDLLILCGYRFCDAVAMLSVWLRIYKGDPPRSPRRTASEKATVSASATHNEPTSLGDLLQNELWNHRPLGS